jgi:predicted nucleotidyltransferase
MPDYQEYIRAWRKRWAKEEQDRLDRAEQLRRVARECARRLVQDYDAERVYLFGSLLSDDRVHDRSDIDLAVEGLDGDLYFRALADLWKLLPEGAELDLVPLEQAWPTMLERVKSEGMVLDVSE